MNKILVGNKCDLSNRVVSTEEGQALAEKYGIPFYEVSAKTKVNVAEAFQHITKDVQERLDAAGAGTARGAGRGAGRGGAVDVGGGARGGGGAGKKTGCC